MSEIVTLPQDPLIESARDAASAPSQTAPVVGAAEHGIASTPVLAVPAAAPTETHVLLELIGRGLASDADDATRTAARDLWARFAQTIGTAAPALPTAPMMPAAPMMPPAPVMPPAPMFPPVPFPTSPIVVAARALRQMPPDQLLDLMLQRLRAALPSGAPVPAPKGIQFPLVPVTPPPGSR